MTDAQASGPAVTVVLPRSLVAIMPGTARRMTAVEGTVAEVIADVEARVPGFADRVLEAGPAIRTHLNVFVDGERASLATPVAPGATVHVIPAVSGG
ncbi:MAG: MoaD/ThiS family protein [Chloroflexota bacterium]